MGCFLQAGVLMSFWLIAAVLVALRAGGRLLGWGFQFQDPVVLIITASLFFLIGLNLFGVFEIGSVFTRLGSRLAGARGEAGSFFSGLLATAVATPCTAPFMGSALGYALTHSLPAAFGVFTALALGMSAPYVLLSAFPALVARLPKPGKWMETFKQIMGFPMMAAAIWMIFVFSALADSAGVIRLLAALLISGMGAWNWGRWGGSTVESFPYRRGGSFHGPRAGERQLCRRLCPRCPACRGRRRRQNPDQPAQRGFCHG